MGDQSAAGKVALVTGGSSGIGESIVKLLCSKGYKVVFTGSNKEKVTRVASDCSKMSPGSTVDGVVLDFSDPLSGKKAVEETIVKHGRLDVLVNNAGIFGRTSGGDAQSFEAYRKVMTINLDATVAASLAAVEELKKTKGQMVLISSTASIKAHERSYAYCASKAAMTMFGKCLAIDLAGQVRVNIVSPGPVVTDIFKSVGVAPEVARVAMGATTLEGRAGEPDEVAALVEFLLSSKANYINGSEMLIDGGYLLKPSASNASNVLKPHATAKQD